MNSEFGPVIYAYTRKQALEDGEQVAIDTKTSREAGFTVPVFLTRAVWVTYVEIPVGVEAQDEEGRLWDILWMSRLACSSAKRGGESIILVKLRARNTNGAPRMVTLKAEIGPMDMNDPSPAITIMLPQED